MSASTYNTSKCVKCMDGHLFHSWLKIINQYPKRCLQLTVGVRDRALAGRGKQHETKPYLFKIITINIPQFSFVPPFLCLRLLGLINPMSAVLNKRRFSTQAVKDGSSRGELSWYCRWRRGLVTSWLGLDAPRKYGTSSNRFKFCAT